MFLLFFLISFILSSFEEFFPDIELNESYSLSNYRYIFINNISSLYISNCLFFQITTEANGGVIFCQIYEINILLIEDCSFSQCQVTRYQGGAIYYDCPEGQFLMNRICSGYCYTKIGSSFQFAMISTSTLGKNSIYMSSIYKSSHDGYSRYHSFGLIFGNQIVQSLNQTNCQLCLFSSLYSFSSNSLILSYSTIFQNEAHVFICLYLASGYNNTIFNLNFINNSQSSNENGLVYNWGDSNTSILNSIFLNNILLKNSTLFYIESGNLNFFECQIDNFTHNTEFLESFTYLPTTTFDLTFYYNDSCNIIPSNLPPTPAQTIPPSPTGCSIYSCPIDYKSFSTILIDLILFRFLNIY